MYIEIGRMVWQLLQGLVEVLVPHRGRNRSANERIKVERLDAGG